MLPLIADYDRNTFHHADLIIDMKPQHSAFDSHFKIILYKKIYNWLSLTWLLKLHRNYSYKTKHHLRMYFDQSQTLAAHFLCAI